MQFGFAIPAYGAGADGGAVAELISTGEELGFASAWLADHIAGRWRLGTFRRAERAREVVGVWEGHDVRVLKPQTYMNRSGAALAPLRALPGFDPSEQLLILVDDVALPLGTFRLRGAGTAGGADCGLSSCSCARRKSTASSA